MNCPSSLNILTPEAVATMDVANPSQLDFVCVGPQRTASSWLHKHLQLHPQLAFPQHVKETMFFDVHYHRGLPWYWQHFAEVADGQKQGEIATTYFDSSSALQRLKQFPNLRVIINVRNPVERTYSLFCHHRVKGRVPDDFFEAVKAMPRIETSGRYAIYCERWEQAFGKERCHYLFQQEVESSPQQVVDEVCSFLDVEPHALAADAAERFGQLTRPRWPVFAKTAAKLATAIRSRGLHRPIEFAKRVGLKRFVYGEPVGKEVIPTDVQRYLEHLHSEDLAYLQGKFASRFRF